jgi:hypothetical protein
MKMLQNESVPVDMRVGALININALSSSKKHGHSKGPSK